MKHTSVQKILIADDSGPVRELLARIFARSGYDVSTSNDGEDALMQFHRHNPDLLITDVDMPRINGFELCERVRLVSDIPIVLMTASDLNDGKFIQTAVEAGADAILTKPFDLEEVLAQIEALLAKSKAIADEKSQRQRAP